MPFLYGLFEAWFNKDSLIIFRIRNVSVPKEMHEIDMISMSRLNEILFQAPKKIFYSFIDTMNISIILSSLNHLRDHYFFVWEGDFFQKKPTNDSNVLYSRFFQGLSPCYATKYHLKTGFHYWVNFETCSLLQTMNQRMIFFAFYFKLHYTSSLNRNKLKQ